MPRRGGRGRICSLSLAVPKPPSGINERQKMPSPSGEGAPKGRKRSNLHSIARCSKSLPTAVGRGTACGGGGSFPSRRLACGTRNYAGCPPRGQPGSFNGSCRQAALCVGIDERQKCLPIQATSKNGETTVQEDVKREKMRGKQGNMGVLAPQRGGELHLFREQGIVIPWQVALVWAAQGKSSDRGCRPGSSYQC